MEIVLNPWTFVALMMVLLAIGYINMENWNETKRLKQEIAETKRILSEYNKKHEKDVDAILGELKEQKSKVAAILDQMKAQKGLLHQIIDVLAKICNFLQRYILSWFISEKYLDLLCDGVKMLANL